MLKLFLNLLRRKLRILKADSLENICGMVINEWISGIKKNSVKLLDWCDQQPALGSQIGHIQRSANPNPKFRKNESQPQSQIFSNSIPIPKILGWEGVSMPTHRCDSTSNDFINFGLSWKAEIVSALGRLSDRRFLAGCVFYCEVLTSDFSMSQREAVPLQ